MIPASLNDEQLRTVQEALLLHYRIGEKKKTYTATGRVSGGLSVELFIPDSLLNTAPRVKILWTGLRAVGKAIWRASA